jgi:hypothetical protein
MSRLGRFATLVVAFLAVVVAACATGPAPDGPSGVLRTALDRAAAKDVPGLQALACAGQQDAIANALGLPGLAGADPSQALGQLLPGVDVQALLDSAAVDVSKVRLGAEVVTGDAATVPVSGDVTVTFDKEKLRPILVAALAAQGRTLDDAELNALLDGLATAGQAFPVDRDVHLVREDGAWKVCEPVPPLGPAPGSSGAAPSQP